MPWLWAGIDTNETPVFCLKTIIRNSEKPFIWIALNYSNKAFCFSKHSLEHFVWSLLRPLLLTFPFLFNFILNQGLFFHCFWTERERRGKKHRCKTEALIGCLQCSPRPGIACTELGNDPATFQLPDDAPTNWATPARTHLIFYKRAIRAITFPVVQRGSWGLDEYNGLPKSSHLVMVKLMLKCKYLTPGLIMILNTFFSCNMLHYEYITKFHKFDCTFFLFSNCNSTIFRSWRLPTFSQ